MLSCPHGVPRQPICVSLRYNYRKNTFKIGLELPVKQVKPQPKRVKKNTDIVDCYVSLTPNQDKKLIKLASKQGKIRSEVYREAIDQFLEAHKNDSKQREILSSERFAKKWNKTKNTFRFYEKQIEAINELATRTGIKSSELLRMAIEEYSFQESI